MSREWLLCDKCGDYVLLEDVFEPLYTTTLCTRCMHFPTLLGPDEEIDWVKYGNSNTYFGVELEFHGDCNSGFKIDNKSKYLEYKCEESLLHGFEVVTHPASYAMHYNTISKLFKHKVYNSSITHKAAMHIHVNIDSPLFVGDVTYTVGRIMYFLYLHRDRFKELFGRDQDTYDRFCSLVPEGFEDATYANFKYSAKRISENMKKTYAVLIHEHTVEFRMFNTTNNKDKYMENINIVLALINIATMHSINRYDNFELFETVLDRTKRWMKYETIMSN